MTNTRLAAILLFAGLVLAAIALAGCQPFVTAPVFLKHSQTGRVVVCGPYRYRDQSAIMVAFQEQQCITDYQRQGYDRVPGP